MKILMFSPNGTTPNIANFPNGRCYNIDGNFVIAEEISMNLEGDKGYALIHFQTGSALGMHEDPHQLLGLRQRLIRWDWGGDQSYVEAQEDALDDEYGYMHIISDFADIPVDPDEEETGIYRRPDNAQTINRNGDLPTRSFTELVGDFEL